VLTALKQRARRLKAELKVLFRAYQDLRTPLLAKVVMMLVIAYALSPIDLIPDFIPILGLLDDLLLVPLGIALALRLVPSYVIEEHRASADEAVPDGAGLRWVGVAFVVAIWLLIAYLLLRFGRALFA